MMGRATMTQRLQPDPDLEALIERLNRSARAGAAGETGPSADGEPAEATASPVPRARWSLPPPDDDGRQWLERLLRSTREAGASDLMLVVGLPPVIRVDGTLRRLAEDALDSPAAAKLSAALVPKVRRETVQAEGSVDFAFTRAGLGRFRCNVHRERGRWSAAIRLLPEAIPDLRSLHLPASLARFAELDRGLVLVTGPTGSGKTTTLAALLKHVLDRRPVHAITIEDPVEYAHPHGSSVVEHVEVGRDTPSFSRSLRSALRQDPDVLLVGEMRDRESIAIAVTAAETGHLVLSTLHTGDPPQTIHRIVDAYPGEHSDTVRAQLSVSLAGIVSQHLLPRADGRGRVPAVEVLVATPGVRNLIRQGKIAMLRAQMTLEASAGMLSLEASLADLVRQGLIARDEALARARDPQTLGQLLREKKG
jgi:twitching motility protein PilT